MFRQKIDGRIRGMDIENLLNTLGYRISPTKKSTGTVLDSLSNGTSYNDNPTVKVEGVDTPYQRGLVWPLEAKQTLIESIYSHIELGKIVVRPTVVNDERVYDIVDGKQRLNTILSFVKNEFPDFSGRYFIDFSEKEMYEFRSAEIITYELSEYLSDKEVLEVFLRYNVYSVPQSVEFLKHIKEMYDKM